MKRFWDHLRAADTLIVVIVMGVLVTATTAAYAAYFSDHVVPRTVMAGVSLGGLTRDQAQERLQAALDHFQDNGINLDINGTHQVIQLYDIGFDLDVDRAMDAAFVRGHGESGLADIWDRLAAVAARTNLDAPVHFDQAALALQINQAVADVEVPRQDVSLAISHGAVHLATETKPGRVVDRQQATQLIMKSLAALSSTPITLALRDDPPVADPNLAGTALAAARKMLARPLTLQYEDSYFNVSREKIGSWIISQYDGPQLVAGLDKAAIAQYVTRVAAVLNAPSEAAHIATEGGRVTGFTPAKIGKVVQESQLVDLIAGAIMARTDADRLGDTIVIPVTTAKPSLTGLESIAGITELIGKATTPFTGSPRNRISNIKNGVKFLSGAIVQPGDEFSTLTTLGTVDNTTGYLPELVIKGDRTTPEFGGGLCQVSTTLFRAVMNAALPVTYRRNHSYRVTYYEKDGNGTKIGPGLDATIYQPDLDFKFRNDTSTPVLIIGYVVGDKVTFELYGTKDGRTSHIDGPKLLSEVPAGEPVDLPTDTLPQGFRKQVETPHPGGSAIASYSITYADGHTVNQVFKSRYRPWPAKFLLGTNTGCSTVAQCAAISAALTPSPSPVLAP